MTPADPSTTVRLTLNGEPADAPAGTTVTALLGRLGHDGETPGIAVAVNGAVLRRASWGTTPLHDGDAVEVVTATQGG